MKTRYAFLLTTLLSLCLLCGCGYHLRGPVTLAPPLHTLYLSTPDPYGVLAQNLRRFLRLSDVTLVDNQADATTTLEISQEKTSDQLLGMSETQQTRQYTLSLTVVFQVLDAHKQPLTAPQTLVETRTLTITSDQILASSNEASMLYQEMRLAMVYDIMNRLASKDITYLVTTPKTVTP